MSDQFFVLVEVRTIFFLTHLFFVIHLTPDSLGFTFQWRAFVTTDGTDFTIQEPKPRSTGWYSHKTNGPANWYGFLVSVPTGQLVHIDGPYPAGHWPDISIYRHNLKHLSLPGEFVIADKGYCRDKMVLTPYNVVEPQVLDLMARARYCHEGINGMFKKFCILQNHTSFYVSPRLQYFQIEWGCKCSTKLKNLPPKFHVKGRKSLQNFPNHATGGFFVLFGGWYKW